MIYKSTNSSQGNLNYLKSDIKENKKIQKNYTEIASKDTDYESNKFKIIDLNEKYNDKLINSNLDQNNHYNNNKINKNNIISDSLSDINIIETNNILDISNDIKSENNNKLDEEYINSNLEEDKHKYHVLINNNKNPIEYETQKYENNNYLRDKIKTDVENIFKNNKQYAKFKKINNKLNLINKLLYNDIKKFDNFINEDIIKNKNIPITLFNKDITNKYQPINLLFQINKLPYKGEIFIIDNINKFDDNSILKLLIEFKFDINNYKLNINLNILYISKIIDNILNINKYMLDLYKKNKNNIINNTNSNIINDNILDYIKIEIILKKYNIKDKVFNILTNKICYIKKINTIDIINILSFNELEDIELYELYSNIIYNINILNIEYLENSRYYLTNYNNGIINEGSTCYMNAVIQSIYSIDYILIIIMNYNPNKIYKNLNKTDKDFIKNLQIIFNNLYSVKMPIHITDIFKYVGFKDSNYNKQFDASEIYIKILDKLIEINEDIKNKCQIILKTHIDNTSNQFISTVETSMNFLDLDILNCSNINQCLYYFFSKVYLNIQNNNQYQYVKDDKIIYIDAIKYYKIKKLPDILFIFLKRFYQKGKTENFYKNNSFLEYNKELDITEFLDDDIKSLYDKEIYILHNIIIHRGELNTGHYINYNIDHKNNRYIEFNDDKVNIVSEYDIFNKYYGGEVENYEIINDETNININKIKKESNENVYILIYYNKKKLNELVLDNIIINNSFNRYNDNLKDFYKKQFNIIDTKQQNLDKYMKK